MGKSKKPASQLYRRSTQISVDNLLLSLLSVKRHFCQKKGYQLLKSVNFGVFNIWGLVLNCYCDVDGNIIARKRVSKEGFGEGTSE